MSFKTALTQNQQPSNQFNPNSGYSQNRGYQSGQPTNNGQNYGYQRTGNQQHQQIRDQQVSQSRNIPSQRSNQTIQTGAPRQNTQAQIQSSNQLPPQSNQPQSQLQTSQSQQIIPTESQQLTMHQPISSSQHPTQSSTTPQQLPQSQPSQSQQQQPSSQSNAQQPSHGSSHNRPFPQQPRPVTTSNKFNADLMFHGTKYEVKCSQTFAYYDGYVIDYDPLKQKLIVAFGWKPIQNVSPSDVRPCLHESAYTHWIPREGEKVECKAKAEEHEPFGWWPCYIQTVKDNFFLIKFEGWEDSHSEILMRDMLRPYNAQPAIEAKGLSRLEIPIPDDMYNWVVKSPKEIRYVGQKTGLIHLDLFLKTNKLIAVGTIPQIQNAKKLMEFLWDLQRKFAPDEAQDQETEKKFKEEYEKLKNCYKLTFKFDKTLTRFVIGKLGANVQKAKSIEGVRHISIHEGECTILADDEELAQDARDILEIDMKKYDIPAYLVPSIIGDKGENIKELERRSDVLLISTWRRYCQSTKIPYEEPENPEVATMIVIGPKNNVEIALSLLKREIQFVTTKQQFVDRERNANRQLRVSQGGVVHDRPRGRGRGEVTRGRGRGRGRGGGGVEKDNQQGTTSGSPQESTENNDYQQTENDQGAADNQADENNYHQDEYEENYNDQQYEENYGYEQDYNENFENYDGGYDEYHNDGAEEQGYENYGYDMGGGDAQYNYESQNYGNEDAAGYTDEYSGISRRRQKQQGNLRYVPKPKPQS